MYIKVNDEIMLKKNCFIGNKGDIFVVTNIYDNKATIEFKNDNKRIAITKIFTFIIDKSWDDYFEKVMKEEDDAQEKDWIETILDNSDVEWTYMFNTCITVAAKLPNGYVIVESCDRLDDCDEDTALDICMEKIYHKVAELETYAVMYPSNLSIFEEDYDQGDAFDCDVCSYADKCQES